MNNVGQLSARSVNLGLGAEVGWQSIDADWEASAAEISRDESIALAGECAAAEQQDRTGFRYSLPVNFLAVVMKPHRKAHQKVTHRCTHTQIQSSLLWNR